MENTLLKESWQVNSALSRLGLTQDDIVRAVTAGLNAWKDCTPNHPPSAAGYYAWSETSKALRDVLALKDYVAKNVKNQPLAVNEKLRCAITVATGDENTGRDTGIQPKTSSQKGVVTANAVAANSGWLFPEMEADEKAKLEKINNLETFVLLVHRDYQRQEARFELSKPKSISEDGRIEGWTGRIIFPPIPFDFASQWEGESREEDQTPEIVVNITRR